MNYWRRWSKGCPVPPNESAGTVSCLQTAVFPLARNLFHSIIALVEFMTMQAWKVWDLFQELPCAQTLVGSQAMSIDGDKRCIQQKPTLTNIVISLCK
jgi:hypothetical protein